MNLYVKSDLTRYCGRSDTISFWKTYMRKAEFRFLYAFRMCHERGLKKYWGFFLWGINRTKRIIQISRHVTIGYGFYIGHVGPIYVGCSAVIGNNCSISQCTTIGSNYHRAATIGDNVYIGPNVCIIEDVKIGNNVTVGAGSIVTKDIEENATVGGNPARVLSFKEPGRFVHNKWEVC